MGDGDVVEASEYDPNGYQKPSITVPFILGPLNLKKLEDRVCRFCF